MMVLVIMYKKHLQIHVYMGLQLLVMLLNRW